MVVSHLGAATVHPYQYSLLNIAFGHFLKEIIVIMSPKVESKLNAKTGFVKQRIANRRCFLEPINVD
jgi:hypothetical protein